MQVLDSAHCLTCHEDYKPSDLPKDKPAHCWGKHNPTPCDKKKCGRWYDEKLNAMIEGFSKK